MSEGDAVFAKILGILDEVSPGHNAKASGAGAVSLIDGYHIDSLKVAELSLLLEEAFDINLFLPDLIGSVRDPHDLTVGALVDFVKTSLDGAVRV